MYIRVKLLGEDEVGGRSGDGDEASDGCSIRDAECQTFADHVILLGGILGVSPGLHPLHVWDLDGNLRKNGRNAVTKNKLQHVTITTSVF